MTGISQTPRCHLNTPPSSRCEAGDNMLTDTDNTHTLEEINL